MQIKDIMSSECCFVPHTATLKEAAQKMLENDCGCIPVAGDNDKLRGIVTDRDIATRGIAKGLGPDASVSEVMTEKVLYCFESDSTQDVAKNMSDNQVRRLIVLNNPEEKRLVGIVSVCDIVTANDTQASISGDLIKCVSEQSGKNNQSREGSRAA